MNNNKAVEGKAIPCKSSEEMGEIAGEVLDLLAVTHNMNVGDIHQLLTLTLQGLEVQVGLRPKGNKPKFSHKKSNYLRSPRR